MKSRILMGLQILVLCCASQLPAQAGESGDESFRFAKSLMLDRKEYRLAVAKFEKFILEHPTHASVPDALSSLGECYSHIKEYSAAAKSYATLLAKFPAAPAQLRYDAMLYGGHARYNQARQTPAEAERVKPYRAAAEQYSLLLVGGATKPPTGLSEVARFWRGKSYDEWAGAEIATGKKDAAGKLRELARKDFEIFLKLHPNAKLYPTVLFSAGYVYYEEKKYGQAIRKLRLVVAEYAKSSVAEDAQYYLGECLLGAEKYTQARTEYDKAFQHPSGKYRLDARDGMAWCDYREKKFKAAAAGFLAAAKLTKEKPAALQRHFQAGAAYHAAGDYAAAERELKLVIAEPTLPAYPEALIELGTMQLDRAKRLTANGDQAEKQKLLTDATVQLRKVQARALAGQDSAARGAEATAFLGEAYLDQKKYAEAAKTYALIPEKWPQDSRVPLSLFHQALAQRELGKIAEAKELLKQLFIRYPRNRLRLQAAYAMADYQASLGKVKESRGAYRWLAERGIGWAKALSVRETGKEDAAFVAKAKALAVESLFRLAESYYPTENVAEAGKQFAKLLATYPHSKQAEMAQYRLGEIAHRAGRKNEAIKQYRGVIARQGAAGSPAWQHAHLRLGELLYRAALSDQLANSRAKKLAEAETLLSRLLVEELGEDILARAQYRRAEVRYAQNHKKDALADYEAAVAGKGADKDAAERLFGLAWCYRDLGKTDKANAAFETLLKKHADSSYAPNALFILGVAKFQAKQYPAALAAMERLAQEYPKSEFASRAQIEQGKILGATGKHTEAIAAFSAFADKNPKHQDTANALYLLSWEWSAVAAPKLKAARKADDAYRLARGDAVAERKAERDAKRKAAYVIEDKRAAVLLRLAQNFPAFADLDTVQFHLGEIYYGRRAYTKALPYYETALQAVATRPQSEVGDETMYRLAMCHLRLSEAAARAYDKAAQAKKSAATLDALKQARGRKKDVALKSFLALAKKYPQAELAGEGHFRSAEIFRTERKFKDAHAHYRQAMKAAPKAWFSRAALYGIGVCFLESGKHRESLTVFKKFLTEFSQGEYVADANWGAGQACFGLEAYTDAKDYFKAALAADRESEAAARARLGLGLIPFAKGDWATAREELLKVDAFHSRWAEPTAMALLKASEAARKLGEKASARKDLERIIVRYPQSTVTPLAREALKKLH